MADQWFAVIDSTTGELASTGTVVDDAALPPHLTALPLATAPDFSVHAWDPVARALVPRPVLKAEVHPRIADAVERLQMWRAIAAEATTHGDTAIATAATAHAETIYAALKAAITAWQAAT